MKEIPRWDPSPPDEVTRALAGVRRAENAVVYAYVAVLGVAWVGIVCVCIARLVRPGD